MFSQVYAMLVKPSKCSHHETYQVEILAITCFTQTFVIFILVVLFQKLAKVTTLMNHLGGMELNGG